MGASKHLATNARKSKRVRHKARKTGFSSFSRKSSSTPQIGARDMKTRLFALNALLAAVGAAVTAMA